MPGQYICFYCVGLFSPLRPYAFNKGHWQTLPPDYVPYEDPDEEPDELPVAAFNINLINDNNAVIFKIIIYKNSIKLFKWYY